MRYSSHSCLDLWDGSEGDNLYHLAIEGGVQPHFGRSTESGTTRNIIHDWSDEHAVEILRNCRHAMHEQGTILLVERLVHTEAATSLETLCADLDMLVLGGGRSARERTEAEYRALCRAAGCELTRVIPTQSDYDYSVIEVVLG